MEMVPVALYVAFVISNIAFAILSYVAVRSQIDRTPLRHYVLAAAILGAISIIIRAVTLFF